MKFSKPQTRTWMTSELKIRILLILLNSFKPFQNVNQIVNNDNKLRP